MDGLSTWIRIRGTPHHAAEGRPVRCRPECLCLLFGILTPEQPGAPGAGIFKTVSTMLAGNSEPDVGVPVTQDAQAAHYWRGEAACL